ncbi:MAG: class II aldolase/adducin family protein [Sedimentisphaerales bacterium]|nr:class II aldolase/adducin family protein [Sedimentisphaerales bacterium]HNY78186.1 class II aldolase/adducin family protein [Sedimentisphaerales bacterium]HOC65389.1 class II aldolase/adducin family protein [Sedimentisphaerales bacterium]HOH63224.1 class II aldolase/adducin family protein [Sedimentisphaerales bacterium]HQA92253.1 class II aldolase/adducin family protein [Sedimentisphaerales bacterium]
MKYEYLHPRDELVLTMQRIYRYKMTTTSGGNLSILDENGDIWITPTGVDKGTLTANDIVCVRADGRIEGLHRPSSEYPFHKAIYAIRPDLKAIVHAHPMALVAFSIAHKVPDTRLFHQAWRSNGTVAFAPYGVPGSEDLGRKIAQKYAEGFDSVILENHGVCCAGQTLQEAFGKFETLEMCCKILIKAHTLGEPTYLTDQQLQLQSKSDVPLEAFDYDPSMMSIREKELRNQISRFVERGYRQRLLTMTTGTFSARIDREKFLITPYPLDRHAVLPEEIVMIRKGKKEFGKHPSRAVLAHKAIYDAHPDVMAIANACPLNAMAFSVCRRTVDTRTIPESYIFVREVSLLPFETVYNDFALLARTLTLQSPAAVLANSGVMVVGDSVLAAFDKLEVLECSAEAVLDAQPIGGHVAMNPEIIDELIEAFHLEPAPSK